MFCGACGGCLVEGAKFCTSCGRAVGAAAPTAILDASPPEDATVISPIQLGTRAGVKLPAARALAPDRSAAPVREQPPVMEPTGRFPAPRPTGPEGASLRVPHIICAVLGLFVVALWGCENWIGPELSSLYELPMQVLLLVCAVLMLARMPVGVAYFSAATCAVGLITVLVVVFPEYSLQGTPLGKLPSVAIVLSGLIAVAVAVVALTGKPLRTVDQVGRPVASGAAVLVTVGLLLENVGTFVLWVLLQRSGSNDSWFWVMAGLSLLSALLAAVALVVTVTAYRKSASGLNIAVIATVCAMVTGGAASWASMHYTGYWTYLRYGGESRASALAQSFALDAVWPAVSAVLLLWCDRCARQVLAQGDAAPLAKPRSLSSPQAAVTDSSLAARLPTPSITFWVTFFFGAFGLIPAVMHSNRAAALGQPGSRYWKAFWFGALATFLLWVVLMVGVWVLFYSLAAGYDPGV